MSSKNWEKDGYMEKSLPCSIIMARFSGGEKFGGTGVHLTVEDEISGCRVLDVYMSLEEFGKAVTASVADGVMEFYPDGPIGMKHEHKEIVVPFDWSHNRGNIRAEDEALAPFETDGWLGRRDDLHNHHRSVG